MGLNIQSVNHLRFQALGKHQEQLSTHRIGFGSATKKEGPVIVLVVANSSDDYVSSRLPQPKFTHKMALPTPREVGRAVHEHQPEVVILRGEGWGCTQRQLVGVLHNAGLKKENILFVNHAPTDAPEGVTVVDSTVGIRSPQAFADLVTKAAGRKETTTEPALVPA